MRLCKHEKKPSITFIKYFSKIIRQIKENAVFFFFLIETDFVDTRSYFLPADQNVYLPVYAIISICTNFDW